VNSHDIVKAISESHAKDLVVTECKDGPTWTQAHSRMDVWTMTRSWSNMRIIGYEVKVSRQDFKQDEKWPSYLSMCNQLYFVCPKDLIRLEEIPEGVGLKYCHGTRLRTIKKAAWRDMLMPDSLWLYILMCRAQVVAPHHFDENNKEARSKEWQHWLESKEENKSLGYRVSRAVRDHVDRVESENRRLKAQNEFYQSVKELCDQYKLDSNTWRLEQRVKECAMIFPPELVSQIKETARALTQAVSQIEKVEAGGGK